MSANETTLYIGHKLWQCVKVIHYRSKLQGQYIKKKMWYDCQLAKIANSPQGSKWHRN